jgi:hypothetical protein
MCSYNCVEGFANVSENPLCKSSIDLQVEQIGGTQGALAVFFVFCAFTMFLWITIALRSKCIRVRTKDEYENVLNGLPNSNQEDDWSNCILGEQAMHMRDTDIYAHYYRMYLIGENSINLPWYIPKDFPTDALAEVPKDRLLQFIKREQWTLDWSTVQRQTYYLTRLLFPYASEWMHRSHRR